MSEVLTEEYLAQKPNSKVHCNHALVTYQKSCFSCCVMILSFDKLMDSVVPGSGL